MQKIRTEVRQFIVDNFLFGQTDRQMKDDESFLETGIIDSTGVLELVAFLEARYQIQVDDQDLVPTNLDSVDRLIGFIERKTQGKTTAEAN